jgi:hypothetical protein
MGIFHGVCAGTLISKKISRQKKKKSMAYFLLCRPHVLHGKSSLSAADKMER